MTHRLRVGSSDNTLQIVADNVSQAPGVQSIEHRFKEHQWGFGTDRAGALVMYEVRHPHWATFPLRSIVLNWNWEEVYGPEWAFLQDREPASVILAAGSAIEVFWPTRPNVSSA